MDKHYYLSLHLRAALTVLLYFVCLLYLFFPVCYLLDLPYFLSHAAAAGALAFFFAAFPALFEKSFEIKWIDAEEISPGVKAFLADVTSVNGIPFPKIGVIDHPIPNIYGYGVSPASARLVLTRGLLETLDEDELKAVLACELGNIKSWSFAVLGLALYLPLLCARGIRSLVGAGKGARGAVLLPVAALYVVMHVGMFFAYPYSRYRNYYADAFTCFVMDDVNVFIQAILKMIAHASAQTMAGDYEAVNLAAAVKPLGFLDPSFCGHLVLKSLDEASDDVGVVADLIKKDMLRPRLATELMGYSHLHPFLRVMYIEENGISMGLLSNFDFRGMKLVSEGSGASYFVYEYLNIFGFLLGLAAAAVSLQLYGEMAIAAFNGLLVFTCLFGVKLYLSYPGSEFRQAQLGQIEEQAFGKIFTLMPVSLSGRIYPQHIPGKIFSNNAVLVEDTGVAVLDFQKPLGFFEVFFRLRHSQQFKEQNATVLGWYRHFDISTLEVYQIVFEDGAKVTSPVYRGKVLFIVLLFALAAGFFAVSQLGLLIPGF